MKFVKNKPNNLLTILSYTENPVQGLKPRPSTNQWKYFQMIALFSTFAVYVTTLQVICISPYWSFVYMGFSFNDSPEIRNFNGIEFQLKSQKKFIVLK